MSNQVFPAAVRGLAYTVVKTQENSAIIQESPSFASARILKAQNPRWHWRLEYSVVFDNILNPNPQLTYTDLQTMLGFCQARYTNYDDFLYSDPDDNTVGPGVITATWQPNYPYMLGAIIIASGHALQIVSAPGGAKSGTVTPSFNVSGGTTTDGGLTWQDLGAGTNGGTNWPNPQAQLQVVTDGTNYYSPVQRNLGGQFYEDITDLDGTITVYANGVLASPTLRWGGLAIPGFSSNGLYLTWGASAPTQPVTASFSYYFRVRMEEDSEDFEKFVNEMWAIGGEENVQGKGYLKFESAPPAALSTFTARGNGGTGLPAPPINPPAPGLQVVNLYPSNIQLFSYPNFGNMSYGTAGTNNYTFQRMSTSGGLIVGQEPKATFSGFSLPPQIPFSLVRGVYAYIAWTHKADPRNAIAESQTNITGFVVIGGFSSIVTESGLFTQNLVGNPPFADNFPFSSVSITVQLVRSLGPSFNLDDELTASVSLVVYYV